MNKLELGDMLIFTGIKNPPSRVFINQIDNLMPRATKTFPSLGILINKAPNYAVSTYSSKTFVFLDRNQSS